MGSIVRLACSVVLRQQKGLLHLRPIATSSRSLDKGMKQVEVDEPDVQKQLGEVQMNFVKKAERLNLERAKKHRKFRSKDWQIAMFCFSLAISIYGYTIYAIKQERFLDDFVMPDPMEQTNTNKR